MKWVVDGFHWWILNLFVQEQSFEVVCHSIGSWDHLSSHFFVCVFVFFIWFYMALFCFLINVCSDQWSFADSIQGHHRDLRAPFWSLWSHKEHVPHHHHHQVSRRWRSSKLASCVHVSSVCVVCLWCTDVFIVNVSCFVPFFFFYSSSYFRSKLCSLRQLQNVLNLHVYTLHALSANTTDEYSSLEKKKLCNP